MNQMADLVLDSRNVTGESPLWSVSEQSLYWVDIPQKKLMCWHAPSCSYRSWTVPEMLACIARAGDSGQWVAGLETGIFGLQLLADGELQCHMLAPVRHAQAGMRFNDGRCDRQGRFWASTMVKDMTRATPIGAIYCYEKKIGLKKCLEGFMTPNGLAFSPDGTTMYLSDSHPAIQKIWAFDFDTSSGTPSNQRLFVDMGPLPGRPDGAAVDAEGYYWICANDAGMVHRFSPSGKLDRSLPVPVKKPSMCAFGGKNLETLYVTSIRPEGIDLSDQPLAGGLFALHPGVSGLAEAACYI
jgi:sugar lactone lactonase YvrE